MASLRMGLDLARACSWVDEVSAHILRTTVLLTVHRTIGERLSSSVAICHTPLNLLCASPMTMTTSSSGSVSNAEAMLAFDIGTSGGPLRLFGRECIAGMRRCCPDHLRYRSSGYECVIVVGERATMCICCNDGYANIKAHDRCAVVGRCNVRCDV